MPKQKLVKIIKHYHDLAQNIQEKNIASEILNKIKNDQDFFVRKKIDGKVDIASSVLLFTSDYKKVLFMDHVKLNTWTLPGGHADGEIDLYKVALDELREEVGIDIEYDINHQISPTLLYKFDYTKEIFGHVKSIINLFYIVTCPSDQTPQILEPDKCREIRWMDIDDVKKLATSDKTQVIYKFIEVWENLVK